MSLQENGNYEGWKQQFSIKLNEQQERAVRTAEGSVLLGCSGQRKDHGACRKAGI